MNIKSAADMSRLPAKTIRYYEDIGLIRPRRSENGYREFSPQDLSKLAFIGRARSLGFSVEDCRVLLSLYDDQDRDSADVKRLAKQHLDRIGQKIEELRSIQRVLNHLVQSCHGDLRPDCPIIDDLARGGNGGAPAGQPLS
jgi:Cu(I)-responsive transcriptional regulator